MLAPGEEPPPPEPEVPVASLSVDFGGGRTETLAVLEGQALERAVSTFAAKWQIAAAGPPRNHQVADPRDERLILIDQRSHSL
eukprot:979328-Prorocentrum_minimum.AAC.2